MAVKPSPMFGGADKAWVARRAAELQRQAAAEVMALEAARYAARLDAEMERDPEFRPYAGLNAWLPSPAGPAFDPFRQTFGGVPMGRWLDGMPAMPRGASSLAELLAMPVRSRALTGKDPG